MANLKSHADQLNLWHLELAIVDQAISRVFLDLSDFDEELGAMGHVLGLRLHALVESCPFPAANIQALCEPDLVTVDDEYPDPDLEAAVAAAELVWFRSAHD